MLPAACLIETVKLIGHGRKTRCGIIVFVWTAILAVLTQECDESLHIWCFGWFGLTLVSRLCLIPSQGTDNIRWDDRGMHVRAWRACHSRSNLLENDRKRLQHSVWSFICCCWYSCCTWYPEESLDGISLVEVGVLEGMLRWSDFHPTGVSFFLRGTSLVGSLQRFILSVFHSLMYSAF